jgi:hypothetical protein
MQGWRDTELAGRRRRRRWWWRQATDVGEAAGAVLDAGRASNHRRWQGAGARASGARGRSSGSQSGGEAVCPPRRLPPESIQAAEVTRRSPQSPAAALAHRRSSSWSWLAAGRGQSLAGNTTPPPADSTTARTRSIWRECGLQLSAHHDQKRKGTVDVN